MAILLLEVACQVWVDQAVPEHWDEGLGLAEREGSCWKVGPSLGVLRELCWETLSHCDHLHHCSFVEQVRSLDQEDLLVDQVVLDHWTVVVPKELLVPFVLGAPWVWVLPSVLVDQLVLAP